MFVPGTIMGGERAWSYDANFEQIKFCPVAVFD